jgi:hypothetical protein
LADGFYGGVSIPVLKTTLSTVNYQLSTVNTMHGLIIVRWVGNLYRQLRTICCVIAIAVTLSGCVEYRTGINFQSLNYGEVVQQIRLGEQLTSFSQVAVQNWIKAIEQRTQQLSGKVEREDSNLKITIPFNNARDLENKINQYFSFPSTSSQSVVSTASSGTDGIQSHLKIEQNNFLFLVRNHLIYDIDLRALTAKSVDPKVSIASAAVVDLSFSLQSPWGSKSNRESSTIDATQGITNGETIWQLEPGKLNQIDAVFWLPNPLGIGAVIIVLISVGGYYLKYRQLPGLQKN